MASIKICALLIACLMIAPPVAEGNDFIDLVKNVAHKIYKVISAPEFKEHLEFVSHQCKVTADVKIKLGEFDHEVNITCPDWSIDCKGNAGTKFGALSEATGDLLHQAINQKQVITHEEVHAWTKR